MNEIGVIVLAAGLGKRMQSRLPKVVHSLCGKPLILHVLATAGRLKPEKVAIVVGHGAEAVKRVYGVGDVAWVLQPEQLGTGHAVLCARHVFEAFAGDLLILSGDVPLISERTLRGLIDTHRQNHAALTLVTASVNNPAGYGRVLAATANETWHLWRFV